MDAIAQLNQISQLPPDERLAQLGALGQQVADDLEIGQRPEAPVFDQLIAALTDAVERGEGDPRARLIVGESLGRLGDPRLRTPEDADYWAEISVWELRFKIARYPVTNAEYRRFVESGGYYDRAHWSEAGWAWLQSCEEPWPTLASRGLGPRFTVDNQPVVGVSWYEAEAFARSHGARMPSFDERMWTVRGEAKRPYPWGEPFGRGNANTQEEVLQRPCAVGLYRQDCTPDGVFDLAGNIAEWTCDLAEARVVIAPGAWSQASLSSWAKARSLQTPDCRGADLGFRLARD